MKSPPSKRKCLLPTWGKSKRDTKTPSSSDQCSKGDSSTSHSDADNGWGNINIKFKDRRRTSPRATTGEIKGKDHPQTQGTQVTGYGNWARKRPASPARDHPASKRITSQREAWISGGKEAIAKWTGIDPLRKTIRSFGYSEMQNMIT
jgi:hypothetical protein